MRDIRVITPDDLGDGIVWNEQTKKYEVSQSGGSSYPFGVGLRMKGGGTALPVNTGYNSVNFTVCGMILENTQGCFCGMRDDNDLKTTRLSLRLYGVSNKLLWQVGDSSMEIKQGDEFPTLNQDLFEPRIWTYGEKILQCTDLRGNIRGQVAARRPILDIMHNQAQRCLFGDISQNSNFINCVIWWVKFSTGANVGIHLVPYQEDGVWGFLDVTGGNGFYGSEFLEPYQPS